MVTLPRLVVAAPASGHGKTTIATGLMAALRGRGLHVSGHKVGPDYIDPGYHALATGRPGRNLDPVLCGAGLMEPLLLHGASAGPGLPGADIAVIEGVMGLYDGRGATGDGSTAHVAALLGAPVLLAVDAAGQGRSVAALVTGFAAYDPAVRIGGVVLNRVGSDRHEEILRSALADTGIPVLGALRRDEAIAAPSRHLGLVPAAERQPAAAAAVRRLAGLIARHVDLGAVVALARSAGPLTGPAWEPAAECARARAGQATVLPGQPNPRPVVAVAGGAAFTFGYAETTELLTAAGADVVPVDPLRDETLPPGTAALVIGGGFPEEYAAGLSANERMRAAVARLAGAGAPVLAECAGLVYLARELDGAPMCGVLPATARMTARLTLGYRDAVAAGDSALAPAGLAVRGHEFHRTSVSPDSAASPGSAASAGGPASPAWTMGARGEGFVRSGVHASYLHLHWAGSPAVAARVADAAARAAKTAREASQ